jgi:hypothetical protein
VTMSSQQQNSRIQEQKPPTWNNNRILQPSLQHFLQIGQPPQHWSQPNHNRTQFSPPPSKGDSPTIATPPLLGFPFILPDYIHIMRSPSDFPSVETLSGPLTDFANPIGAESHITNPSHAKKKPQCNNRRPPRPPRAEGIFLPCRY